VRRRKPIVNSAVDLSHDGARRLNPVEVQASETGVNITVGVVIGLSLFLILLFAGWRFRNLPEMSEEAQVGF
jgi:hypothetical protein